MFFLFRLIFIEAIDTVQKPSDFHCHIPSYAPASSTVYATGHVCGLVQECYNLGFILPRNHQYYHTNEHICHIGSGKTFLP